MNLPTQKLSKEDQKILSLKKKAESDIVYRLVVKIISWKNGPLVGGSLQKTDRITAKEWAEYKKHLLMISKTDSPEKTMGKIKETQQIIQKHGGFE